MKQQSPQATATSETKKLPPCSATEEIASKNTSRRWKTLSALQICKEWNSVRNLVKFAWNFFFENSYNAEIRIEIAHAYAEGSLPRYSTVMFSSIGNKLNKENKIKIHDSWNETIVLTNRKITKMVCFKCKNDQTMACKNYQSFRVPLALENHKCWEQCSLEIPSYIYYFLAAI
jgi:hypothetical protein